MKKIAYIFIMLSFLSGTANAEECREILITSAPDYPPISWRDKKNPKRIIGVAIELVERALAEKDITITSKYLGPWKRVMANAEGGEIDMISGLYMNEDRKAYLEYINPAFIFEPSVVFVKKGKTLKFEKWEDLKDHKGGVRLGDSFGTEFDDFSLPLPSTDDPRRLPFQDMEGFIKTVSKSAPDVKIMIPTAFKDMTF